MLRTNQNSTFRFLVLAGIILLTCATTGLGMPPHPAMLEKAAAAKTALPYFIVNLEEMHDKGVCTGENVYETIYQNAKDAVGHNAAATGPFNVLAILVEFSDHASGSPATLFDSLIFDSNGYTVKDYYSEISYGQLDLVTVNLPSSMGWITAPQTYAYYVNGQNATGSYPNNSQRLVEDLVDAVDASVNFSNYDNDNNNFVDVLVVIHSGQGAEVTGSNNDIWSHKWGISPKLTNDGVYVSSFTIQPEYITSLGDITIGVFAHELAHGFGLPDLYDTDYTSNGVGRWGIMAYGSWLGPSGKGGRPAHPCAWSRIEMGFATPINISSNVNGQLIQDVKSSQEIYRLWTSGNIGNEYFLLENRQKTGYDSYIPNSGLCIWHIDDGKSTNTQEWYPGMTNANHYMVALEQADGLYELEHNNDYGDANDVFPGGLNVSDFNALSSTTSDSYENGISFVAVENIVSNAGNITADLTVGLAAGIDDDTPDELPGEFGLAQNYPNPFNPSTTIEFYTAVGGKAVLEIYNIVGQKVDVLLDGYVSAGTNIISWDAEDASGNELGSGIYFYRLQMNDQTSTKKMTLVR